MKNYENFSNDMILEKFSITTGIKNTFKLLKRNVSKKTIKYLLISLLSFYSASEISEMFNNPNIQSEITQHNLSIINEIDIKTLEKQKDTIDVNIPKDIENTIKNELDTNNTITNDNSKGKFKNPQTLKLSQTGWDMIREHEKLSLTAYKIGDGKITIGWGHAEPLKTSKYKIGDKITKEEAQKLFVKDINNAAEGARRMFRQWIEYRGHDVKITQGQFDAIVSMMFNTGITGFRQSDIAELLELGKYEDAANAILTFNLDDDFSGLEKRRKVEYKKFKS